MIKGFIMQPLLNGYSTYIKGNILKVAFPCLEKLSIFKSKPKDLAENQKTKQNDSNTNQSESEKITAPPL